MFTMGEKKSTNYECYVYIILSVTFVNEFLLATFAFLAIMFGDIQSTITMFGDI